MKLSSGMIAAAITLVSALPAAAEESWTMTTVWPSSLELIEMDRKFVETANVLIKGELTIEFFDGGAVWCPPARCSGPFSPVPCRPVQTGRVTGPVAMPPSLRWRPIPACSTRWTT